MFGITSSISGWWTAINPNIGVTIYNTGHLQVDYETVDLAALVTAAVQDAQLGARRHTLHYAGPAKGVLVQGNALRLEQVLQNLLQNAVKYTPLGGDIEITLSIAEGMARLAVKDEGIGMPPAALPHIFTRFYRAANAEAHHISGLSIGLYVSREITRLYGGDIDVKSTEGVGTTMTVCLPVVEIPNKEQTIDP